MPPAQLGRSAIGFSPAKPAVCRCSIEAPLANRKRPFPRLQELGGTTPWPWCCLHRAHRPSSSRIWSRSKPAFSSSRMSMPVCLADSSRRPCAGTVIVVPGPRKRRWLVARRGSSSKSWVSNQWISVRFERAQASGEAVGVGQVDEVPATRPLLELGAGHEPAEVVALVVREPLAEHREERHLDRGRDLLDPRLQPLGLRAHQLVPVAQDDVLANLLRGEQLGAQRLRDAVEAHAVLERLESAGEARAAQRRLEARTSSANGTRFADESTVTAPRAGYAAA